MKTVSFVVTLDIEDKADTFLMSNAVGAAVIAGMQNESDDPLIGRLKQVDVNSCRVACCTQPDDTRSSMLPPDGININHRLTNQIRINMSRKFPVVFEEACVSINATTWSDLIAHGSNVTFDGVIAVIQERVATGCPFMIEDDNGDILRRIDRMSELTELVETAKGQRPTTEAISASIGS